MCSRRPAVTIREIREKTGLSQAKFGERYGIPTRTIENWETGSRVPPQYVVELLRRVVEMDFPE